MIYSYTFQPDLRRLRQRLKLAHAPASNTAENTSGRHKLSKKKNKQSSNKLKHFMLQQAFSLYLKNPPFDVTRFEKNMKTHHVVKIDANRCFLIKNGNKTVITF